MLMEERVPGDGIDDPPNNDNDDHLSIIAPPPEKSTSTYVIKVPRDQVYRIPPPENATIVENRRKPIGDGNSVCGSRLMCAFVAIFLIGLGTFFVINHFSDSSDHKLPEFSVLHFGRKSSDKHRPNDYGISLRVFNPNKNLEIHYGAGDVTLNYKGREIAHGKSKLVKQDGGSAIVVNHILNGTKGELPGGGKPPVALMVRINVPIDAFKREMMVRCNLEVNSLGEGAKLLSQKCVTN